MNSKDKGVLIVDDDANMRRILQESLSGDGFTNVHTAEDGLECLSVLELLGDEIYVILLDLRMPRMDGAEVVESLLNLHKHVVGVVIITGYGGKESREKFLSLHDRCVVPIDYLQKPFQLSPFAENVENAIKLIHKKRIYQNSQAHNIILASLGTVKSQITTIEGKIDTLMSWRKGFLAEVGMEVIKIVLIAALVLAFILLGLDDFLARLLK